MLRFSGDLRLGWYIIEILVAQFKDSSKGHFTCLSYMLSKLYMRSKLYNCCDTNRNAQSLLGRRYRRKVKSLNRNKIGQRAFSISRRILSDLAAEGITVVMTAQ